MPFEDINNPRSFVAGQDFTQASCASFPTRQFTFVKLSTTNVVVSSTLGGNAEGVMQDKPLSGQAGQVCGPGDTTKVQCGGSFNIGDRIASDANGCAIACATGDYILGHARSAGALGTLASILFQAVGSKE